MSGGDPVCDPLELSLRRPDWSAAVPVTRAQQRGFVVALGLLAWAAASAPWAVARAAVLLCTLFYLLVTVYKLFLVRRSVSASAELRVSPEDLAGAADWPVYSVLVPMYREPESVPGMLRALRELDYPDTCKDVQLLLEADDAPTLAAVAACELPSFVRVTRVAPSQPRTKPKACNIGLAGARGVYLVIYDAEDRPEPDQLKKAVLAFRRVAPDVVCLQSKLNFYNADRNLLARWFTAEYSSWFDLALPGLAACGAPIPLGGTSNHFVTARLRELLGWDAYNVTEDCDLGVRIYRAGYRTRMLDTTTWEEACCRLGPWLRQRTRWLKGYLQTWLVHMRAPGRLLRELGWLNFLHFQVLIGGVLFTFLANPFFWTLALAWFGLRLNLLSSLFPGWTFVMGAFCLFAGNFAFTYGCALGCYRRGRQDLVPVALLIPAYWVLMSVAAWRAFVQFFTAPFLWEKTPHGQGAGGGA